MTITQCAAGQVVATAPDSGPVTGTAFSVPGFNPADGTLTGARINFTAVATFATRATTTSTNGTWQVRRWDNAGVFLTGPALAPLPDQTFAPAPTWSRGSFSSVPMPAVPANIAGATTQYSLATGALNPNTTPSINITETRNLTGAVQVTTGLDNYLTPTVTLTSATVDGFGLVTTSGNTTNGITYEVNLTPCITYTWA